MSRPPKPFLEEMEEAADPGAAPPVPDTLPEGQAMQAVAALSQKRGSALTRFAFWAFSALFSFALSVAAYDFVTGLLARNVILGWAAFALVVVAVVAGLVLALREWGAFLRLKRLDGLRERAVAARATADLKEARRVVTGLTGLYGARGDTAWGRARLAEREGEVMDADALLGAGGAGVADDAGCRGAAGDRGRGAAGGDGHGAGAAGAGGCGGGAGRQPADDPADCGNLRRAVGEFREPEAASPGVRRRWWRRGRLALTDDMIGSVAGGGVLSKLSRRFGEGVVNGALTARVGVAAMELCRPMPFVALERPAVSSLVSRALTGLVSRG